ncbi:TPA_asm: terminase small subunit [Listeria monocytogenes]|nr:terminase small subunit [Listeria monocytogenes]
MKLTKKQIIFCEEYVANFGNATKAAIAAGYSKKTAYSIANENLKKPELQEYIAQLTEAANSERLMKVEEALSISASIARGEPQAYEYIEYDESGDQIAFERKAISASVKERNAALEHIYKANSAFIDKQELDIKSVIFVDDVPRDDDD